MHDSGDRDTFDTGCVRDNGEAKPRPDLISPFSKIRLGEWLRKGAEKYDERNWEKGMPISRCLEAIDRHYCKYQMHQTDEDHMAAIMCNAMFIMHYEEMIKIGNLPASIDNRPSYAPMPIPVFPMLLTTPKLDGARLPYEVKIAEAVERAVKVSPYAERIHKAQAADRMANLKRKVDDAAEPIKTGEAMYYDDKVANWERLLREAQDGLMKELDAAKDKGYGLELDGQTHKPLSATKCPCEMCVPKPPVSKVTGKALVLPDDNKAKLKPVCDICGLTYDIKFYRSDLKRFYCTSCYHMNRIDLKPVINRS